jgi:diketogulonate reductase-like aldo/keto reductase
LFAIPPDLDRPMPDQPWLIDGVRVPRFFYGTAWKEDATQRLTEVALKQGFRAVDTANQRRHYHEAAVGRAIARAIASELAARADLFLQTKFTFRPGQDHRLPYDADAPISAQVEQSFASSLEHLEVDYVDSYLLHGPSSRDGLTSADWAAWRAIEEIHDSGRARAIGVSNMTLAQLQLLCQEARVQPRFVQNRCYASEGWDRDVRAFCATKEITYQGFSLLTANHEVLAHPTIADIAQRYSHTVAQIVFRFALDVGIVPLTGTSSVNHMRADLEVFGFRLDASDVARIESLVER